MAIFEGRFTEASSLRIGVVVARFNDLVTAKLLSACLDCLSRHGIDTS
ncbi:6,7-dimethyl-8-ribityllumazine synthase, partial [Cyanobium sp. HWJ4-Hawea]